MSENGRLQDIFERALEAGPSEREALLARECADDPAMLAHVKILLAGDEEAAANPSWRLLAIEIEASHSAQQGDENLGKTIGQYRVEEVIGSGGMGSVYRAVRADAEYNQSVAIKLISGGADAGEVAARFRQERQILANLQHPNIARLLDGGTTSQGLPYIVMEYIEGVPLDSWCTKSAPSLAVRLRIFRLICSAVHYAHQHMVIHRDLKPGNILVTADGTPKLLDFGIAKLLEGPAEAASATISAFPMMTPRYASPEQVRGEPVTTASDVYSLGVVLFELLAGRSPYARPTAPTYELIRAVCEEEPRRPSSAAPGTRGDLDSIALMALRKAPERRYNSVDQFAEDIRRYEEGYPILARPDTRRYRVAKFVRRNKTACAAAVLIFLTLVGGIAATAREARVANQRFNDVRQLAHSVLFDYHDAIVALPGAIPLRRMLVKDGLVYLDRLSKQAGGDAGLQLELAGGYMKVADVQGSANGSNLGDVRGGLESYRKAIALLEELNRRDPENQEIQELLGLADRFFGQLSQQAGDPTTAADRVRKAIVLFEALCSNEQYKMKQTLYSGKTYYGMDDRRNVLSGSYVAMGRVSGDPNVPNLGDQQEAERWYRRNIAFLESLPPDKNRLGAIGFTHGYLASLKAYDGDYLGELAEQRKVLEIKLRVVQMPPVTPFDRRELAVAYSNVGVGLLDTGDFANALENFHIAGNILESLTAADSADADLRTTLTNNTRRVAETLSKLKRYAEASATFQQAIGMYQELAAKDPDNAALHVRLGLAYIALSGMHLSAGNGSATSEAAGLAEKTLAPLGDGNPTARQLLAQSYFLSGKGDELGGNWTAAHDWYQRSLELWRALRSRGQLAGSNVSSMAQAEQAVAESEKHLKRK